MIVLRTLGTAEIETEVTTLTPSQEVIFAAGVYLILERGKRVSRTKLASLLWPSVEEKARAHRLRQTILQMKKLGILLRASRETIELSGADYLTDIDELRTRDTGILANKESLEFLPGYNPRLSESLSEWVDAKRREIHSITTRILLRELERARVQADWPRVEILASKCLALDAFNEAAVLGQAEAAAMLGGKRKAISILDQYI